MRKIPVFPFSAALKRIKSECVDEDNDDDDDDDDDDVKFTFSLSMCDDRSVAFVESVKRFSATRTFYQ